MTDTLKQAQEILATARKASRAAGPQELFWSTPALDPAVKRLVMLTAGSREALDAIDGLLEAAIRLVEDSPNTPHRLVQHAKRFAAAIIKADSTLRSYVKEGAANPVPKEMLP